jgi:hypothetical protein
VDLEGVRHGGDSTVERGDAVRPPAGLADSGG